MSAWIRSVTGRAYHFSEHSTNPTIQFFWRVWFNSRMRPCQGRDDGATPFTRSIFGSVAHQQSARLTCERQRGQHSPLPPFRGNRSHEKDCLERLRKATGGQGKTGRKLAFLGQEQQRQEG